MKTPRWLIPFLLVAFSVACGEQALDLAEPDIAVAVSDTAFAQVPGDIPGTCQTLPWFLGAKHVNTYSVGEEFIYETGHFNCHNYTSHPSALILGICSYSQYWPVGQSPEPMEDHIYQCYKPYP
jgi:hypothetical protein